MATSAVVGYIFSFDLGTNCRRKYCSLHELMKNAPHSLEQKSAQKNNEGCEIRDKTAIGRYCSRRKRKRQENVLIGTEQREKA